MSSSGLVEEITTDVVVIGAGAAGLSAATRLQERGLGVVVLEARDRVGGRLWTDEVDGAMLEIGGQWVSPDQTALIDTIASLGLTTYPRYRDGDSVYVGADGTRTRFAGERLPVAAASAAEMERLQGALDALATEAGAHEPWAHPRARELDAVTFRDWLRTQSDDEVACEHIAMYLAAAMLTKPAHAFSALQAMLMAASAGSFSHLVDDGFILDRRVVGGLQRVPIGLAERLGDAVRLGSPVRALDWGAEGVVAHADGVRVRARRVLVAMAPPLVSRIDFAPALPRRQHQLHQHLSMGLVIKVHAVYETPFWRADGLAGTAFSPYQLVHEAYDNTNHGDERGTLVGFVSDEVADGLLALDADERKARILASLATYYGDRALDPVVYFESDWGSEEWTRGAYAASFDVGGLSRYGADQRTPVGPIHWACSDLAAEGYQHVDGAIRSGWDAADDIHSALAR